MAALERGDVDVEAAVFIGLEDYFESLNELSLGHGGFIIRDDARGPPTAPEATASGSDEDDPLLQVRLQLLG